MTEVIGKVIYAEQKMLALTVSVSIYGYCYIGIVSRDVDEFIPLEEDVDYHGWVDDA